MHGFHYAWLQKIFSLYVNKSGNSGDCYRSHIIAPIVGLRCRQLSIEHILNVIGLFNVPDHVKENCVAASLLPPMMRAPPTWQDEKCCSFITPYSGKQSSRCCKQSQMLLLDTSTGLILLLFALSLLQKTLFNTGDVTFIPNTIRSHGNK
jgi:hypothetical protein